MKKIWMMKTKRVKKKANGGVVPYHLRLNQPFRHLLGRRRRGNAIEIEIGVITKETVIEKGIGAEIEGETEVVIEAVVAAVRGIIVDAIVVVRGTVTITVAIAETVTAEKLNVEKLPAGMGIEGKERVKIVEKAKKIGEEIEVKKTVKILVLAEKGNEIRTKNVNEMEIAKNLARRRKVRKVALPRRILKSQKLMLSEPNLVLLLLDFNICFLSYFTVYRDELHSMLKIALRMCPCSSTLKTHGLLWGVLLVFFKPFKSS